MKGKIFCNDNLVIMKKLPDESVDLIYVDPPFFTQKNFEDFNNTWNNIYEYLGKKLNTWLNARTIKILILKY